MGRRKKTNKNNKTISVIIFIIVLILGIYEYINYQDVQEKENYDISELGEFPTEDIIKENELQVYFFDVGQGDSTLVVNNGKTMLIDAGNNDDRKITCSIYKKFRDRKNRLFNRYSRT